VSKKTKKERERRDERVFLSLTHLYAKGKKKGGGGLLFCVCVTVLCPHEKCTDRSHVWFKTTPLFFFKVRFFLSLSLSLSTKPKKKKNTIFKTLNDIDTTHRKKKSLKERGGGGGGAHQKRSAL
jgi:hypothetical protein